MDSWWWRWRKLRRLRCVEAVRCTAITVVVVVVVVDKWVETSGVVVHVSGSSLLRLLEVCINSINFKGENRLVKFFTSLADFSGLLLVDLRAATCVSLPYNYAMEKCVSPSKRLLPS